MAKTRAKEIEPRASKAAVKSAVALFKKSMPGRFDGRAKALTTIAASARPTVTAKRLIKTYAAQGVYLGMTERQTERPAADGGDLLIYEVPLSSVPGGGIAVRPALRQVVKAKRDPYADEVDPSDVLELRVRLYRRRGNQGWPATDPQYQLLNALDRDVAGGTVTRAEFNARAAVIEQTDDGWNIKAYVAAQEKIIAEGKASLFSGNTLSPALQMTQKELT